MTGKTVLKIKDSVDLFISDNRYLMVYYMNTRQRKSFRINDEMIRLLETIDGVRNYDEILGLMYDRHAVPQDHTAQIIESLLKNRIITEVAEHQEILPDDMLKRYTRQINYFSEFLDSETAGIAAQKKVSDAHVLIFGCGAMGGNIAVQLAMAGIGKFSLFDYDWMEKSDVSRHMYFREEYVGMKKTEALKEELIRINSTVQVDTYIGNMQPETDIIDIIRYADFIVNTLDEPYIGYTASKISRVCMKFRKPHYIAGGFDAHLASTGELIIPYVTPCVECYTAHFKEALKDWKPKKHPVIKRYTEIGGLASMSLFSSSYACIEILKAIAGLIPMTDNYKVRGEFLFTDMSLTYLNVKKNPDCPICGGGVAIES